MTIRKPPVVTNSDNESRKVGLEVEFSGVELERVAEIIHSLYGGEVEERNRYDYRITGTSLGDFAIELDARLLQKMVQQRFFDLPEIDFDTNKLTASLEQVVDRIAKTVVPVEIGMPPVEIDELEELEKLRQKLHEEQAEGTGSSLINAFGLHINIESPGLDADTLLRYLRSFLLLYPWLVEKLDIDITRNLSPFIDPFPKKYVNLILNPDYEPEMERLVDDYLEHNPTRNRPLDMLPIFSLFKPDPVEEAIGSEKNRPRPTFHYRLPNSKVADPEWSFVEEWNWWCRVEQLAGRPEMISKLSRLYLMKAEKSLISFKKEWVETLSILLEIDE